MSVGRKVPAQSAMRVLERIGPVMSPHVEVLHSAGSLRRNVPLVGDLDVVVVPSCLMSLVGALHEIEGVTLENKHIDMRTRMLKGTVLVDGLSIPFQVFTARPATFGWILMLRTGPSDFTTHLVNIVKPWGFRFHDGELQRCIEMKPPPAFLFGDDYEPAYEAIYTPRELDVWGTLGLEPIHPENRCRRLLEEHAARRTQ